MLTLLFIGMFALPLLFFSLLLMANPITSYDFLKFSTFRTRYGHAPVSPSLHRM